MSDVVSRPEALLFDMGNVLVTFSHDKSCEQMADICGCSPIEVRHHLYDSGLQWKFEEGTLTEAEYYSEICKRLQTDAPLDDISRANSEMFGPIDGTIEIVHRLKRTGIRLVLLSNTSPWHVRQIEEDFDFLPLFDERVLSYEVGCLKPDSKIYEAAIAAAGCAAKRCFFTDDHHENIRAARRCGLDAEPFTDPDTLKTQLCSRLPELDL